MQEDKKFTDPPVEKSLSFVSYNLKQLNITMQGISQLLEAMLEQLKKQNEGAPF